MPNPKSPFHESFPKLIDRLKSPQPARIVKLIGEHTVFPQFGGVDTLEAWGRAMVRLGLSKTPGEAGNPHDFIPEASGVHRRPFHEMLLHVIPWMQVEAELCFVQTLINQTEIPEAGRGAIEHAWRLQLESFGHRYDVDAADYPLYFGDVPKEVPAKAVLDKAA